MKYILIILCIFFGSFIAQASVWQPSYGHKQIQIWPAGKIPNVNLIKGPEISKMLNYKVAGKSVLLINDVSIPTMTIYSPKTNNTGVAVVVFPGGGFRSLAIGLEGSEVCKWLAAHGITGILLKYRVPYSGPYWSTKLRHHVVPKVFTALQDAQRTVALVRFNAKKLHINPNKIGVIGFSAGGYLVAAISTHFKKRLYKSVDSVYKESCRPDFAALLYPGHMYRNGKFVLTPYIHVTNNTPPTFIVQAENDPVDSINNSLVYYIALIKENVPVEMHLYAQGGHAFGIRRTKLPITHWPQLFYTWLKTIGMIKN